MYRNSLIVLLIAFISLASAIEKETFFPLYSTAQLIDNESTPQVSWNLPLSKYQKVDGFWRNSNSLELSGDLKSKIYLIRTQDSFEKIADFYFTWASQDGFELLFSCKARACGSSNDWANRFFNNKRLNGVQGKQLYMAIKKDNEYMAVYLVERPTGQIYLGVKHLLSQDKSASKSSQQIIF